MRKSTPIYHLLSTSRIQSSADLIRFLGVLSAKGFTYSHSGNCIDIQVSKRRRLAVEIHFFPGSYGYQVKKDGINWLSFLPTHDQAEQLLSFFLTPDELEEKIGDFEGGYALMLERHGLGHARRWYWWQVLMLGFQRVFDAACRAAKVWSGFGSA
jgi:hypothetical protein